ncbi:MAG: hypothetical protein ABIH76_00050 [Candidatus Bathyarchaeota archaeon]
MPIQAQQAYTPNELVLNVYTDGVVGVEYNVELDITYPRVEVPLFGVIYENLLVGDQDGIPLDYSSIENGINIDTLGASSATIIYLTSDLTSKSARTWTLALNRPINSSIVLPEEATVVSLNQVPVAIRSIDGKSLLIMPAGYQEITYVIGIVGTRESALALINDAEAKIEDLKANNIIVADAEAKLQEAKQFFNLEQYAEAEELATQAKELAIQA